MTRTSEVFPVFLHRDALQWHEDARCRTTDPEIFFDSSHRVAEAKRVCAQCPVRAECLDFSVTYNERFGIWGGLTQHERAALIRLQASYEPVAL